MKYVIGQLSEGPLTCMEEAILVENLQNLKDKTSAWGFAIHLHFQKPDRDDQQLLDSLRMAAVDDIFTISCVLGLANAILVLRTIKD